MPLVATGAVLLVAAYDLTGCSPNSLLSAVKARVEQSGNSQSSTSGNSQNTVAAPTFQPTAGVYSNDLNVDISDGTSNATIYYTTDGTGPTTSSTLYTGPVSIAGDGTAVQLSAIAAVPGMNNSPPAVAKYTINYSQVSTPQFSPSAPTTFHTDQNVTISDATGGSTIYFSYTSDGSVPTDPDPSNSSTYNGSGPASGVTVPVSGTLTHWNIKAVATKSGMGPSTIASSGTYDIVYQYTLTLQDDGNGSVAPTVPTLVNDSVATNITATPNSGYAFLNWQIITGTGVSIANSSSASTTATLTVGDATLKANFALMIETIAGTGAANYTGDGGLATNATLFEPDGVAVDSAGNVYVAEKYNNCIRKIDTSGNISTVAGVGGYSNSGYTGDNGPATAAKLSYPVDIAVDPSGNLFILDMGNNVVRKVNTNGIITTIAGTGTYGYSGDNGPATSAALNYPWGLAIDSAGNIYIADTQNNRIRKVTPSGTITTIAGNGTAGFLGDNGAATSAEVNLPSGVTVDSSGNVYIADSGNNRIRKVNSGGTITTVAGNGTAGYSGDGSFATSAEINAPLDVAVDASGNLYIADTQNYLIRKVSSTGTISTFAGTGGFGYSGDLGPAILATIVQPRGVAVDSAGKVYIADSMNNVVRSVP